ncbi:MAG: hypothetical protein COB36_13500 [Alphaproteobacteria bacterium]|nr:MAG: hypothetical protein COB36_13500 [Alphaproteobacteria bacterium]
MGVKYKAKVSENDLCKGLEIVAGLIEKYGDDFWPIFDRVEQELDIHRTRSHRLKKHLKRFNQYKKDQINIR